MKRRNECFGNANRVFDNFYDGCVALLTGNVVKDTALAHTQIALSAGGHRHRDFVLWFVRRRCNLDIEHVHAACLGDSHVLRTIVDLHAEVKTSTVHDQRSHFKQGPPPGVVKMGKTYEIVRQVQDPHLVKNQLLNRADAVKLDRRGAAFFDEQPYRITELFVEILAKLLRVEQLELRVGLCVHPCLVGSEPLLNLLPLLLRQA